MDVARQAVYKIARTHNIARAFFMPLMNMLVKRFSRLTCPIHYVKRLVGYTGSILHADVLHRARRIWLKTESMRHQGTTLISSKPFLRIAFNAA